MSTLISLLILVIVLGFIYWVITLIPLPPPFQTIAMIVFALIAIMMLLDHLGVVPIDGLPRLR